MIAGPPVIKDTDIIPFFGTTASTKGSFADAEQSFPELKLSKKTEVPPAVRRDHPAGHHPGDGEEPQPRADQGDRGPGHRPHHRAPGGRARNSQPQSVGTANTFFLTENASANHVTATFWIEKVKKPHTNGHFLQLQYTQTVMLDFNGLRWPHVSVATLRKQKRDGHGGARRPARRRCPEPGRPSETELT